MTSLAALESTLRAMRGKRALLIGDFMLDAYLFGETERVSREAPVLIVRKEREEVRAGAAANTAANLAALQLQVEVMGWRGEDEAGRLLDGILREHGCETGSLWPTADLSTPVKTRVLAGAFGTSRQQVLRIDAGTQPRVPEALQHRLAKALLARGRAADVVVVSDYGLGTLGPVVRAALTSLAKQQVPVCVDSRRNLQGYVGMTAVTPNMPEAEALLGRELGDAEAVQHAAQHIVESLQCEACLLTQGKGGMTLVTQNGYREHVDIVGDAEVTDVTGAGDTVIATLAASIAAGIALPVGMRLANCAAGIVVMRQGAATCSLAEIAAHAHASDISIAQE